MGTKIYNGYKVELTQALDLFDFCSRTKKQLQAIKSKEVSSLLARDTVRHLDRLSVGETISQVPPLTFADRALRERLKELEESAYRDPEVDFASSALFIPQSNSTLVLFYAEQESFVTYWKNLAEVKDYHYQDSTERPRKIKVKEWSERRRIWEQALDPYSIEGEQRGFRFNFTNHKLDRILPDQIIDLLPSVNERANFLAKEMLMSQKIKERELAGEKASTYNIYSWISSITEWMKSDEGKAAFTDLRSKVLTKLIKSPRTQDLLALAKI